MHIVYWTEKNMSALAKAIGMGTISSNGLGLALAGANVDTALLKREFGIILQDKRADATLTAFQDPVNAFNNYIIKRDEIVEQAKDVYNKSLKAAKDAGLPDQAAIDYAKKRAIAYFQDEKELLDLQHPYASSPEGMISLATGVKRRDLLDKYKQESAVPDLAADK